jgi:hypothetical protein
MPLSGDAKAKYQREYMRRRRAGQKPPSRGGSNTGLTGDAQTARIAELEDQIQRMTTRGVQTPSMLAKENELKARIAELEAEVARERAENVRLRAEKQPAAEHAEKLRQPPPLPRTREELLQAKREAEEARKAVRAASLQPEAKIARLQEQLKLRDRRIAQLENDGAVQQENTKLRQQLGVARATLRHIRDNPKGTVYIGKNSLRVIRACLHPDRAQTPAQREQCEAASKAFNALPIQPM